jgi:carbonic anhydrase
MKVLYKSVLVSILLLCGGCTAVAEADDAAATADVVTTTGTVKSVTDGNVVITYESKEDNKLVSESVPSDITVLKNNSTIHSEDLKENEDVQISFTDGKMSVIQVLPETEIASKSTSESTHADAAVTTSSN